MELLPETTLAFSPDADYSVAVLSFSTGLVAGETYTVVWNGVEYDCVAQDLTAVIGAAAISLGSLLVWGQADTGEPFCFVDIPPDLVEAWGAPGMVASYHAETTASIAIQQSGETVHKLDNKYLDLAWLPTVDSTPVQIYSGEAVKSGTYLAVDTSWVSATSKLCAKIDGVMYGPAPVQVIDGVLTCFGNANLLNSGYLASSYPFALGADSSTQAVIVFEDASAHDLVLYNADGIYNRMPYQFLPEGKTTELTAANSDYIEGTVSAIDPFLKSGRRVMCTRNS